MKRYAAIICLFALPCLAITGDFNSDCIVNFEDYAMLASHWQSSGTGDLDSSGTVDFNDLAIFADYWLVDCGVSFCPTDPDAATNPDPANHAVDVAISKTLTWSVADCNGETTLNDVWFGETGSMTQVVNDSATHSYTPTLEKSHSYQWRIDTVNQHGTTTGTVWDFNTTANDAPTASDGSASAVTYIVCPITLSATDDGYPSPPARLKYVITALPADTNAYVQDPVSGGQIRIAASNLPYKLSSWGNTVWFATSTAGSTNFKFKAFDGLAYSAEKTVSITVSANPQDCLSFDGSGYVTIADNDLLDIASMKGVGVCFATRIPYCTLFQKYGTGKGGYWCGLVGGFITARIYDNSGAIVSQIQSQYRYDNGQWANVVIAFNGTAERLELYICFGNAIGGNPNWLESSELYLDTEAADFPLELWPANNDCNLVVGTGYKWEIDAIRAYSSLPSDGFRSLASVQVRTVAGDTDLYVPTPVVRFKCNYDGTNNTYTQVYDDKSATHLIGAFNSSSHVRYLPWVWQWWDASALQGGR